MNLRKTRKSYDNKRTQSNQPLKRQRQAGASLLICLLFLAAGFAHALEWEKTTLEVTPQAAEKTVETNFGFRNTGDHPVEILKIRTTCGCTVAGSARKTYGAGETGSVKVVFTVGGRKGMQEKTVLVKTSEKEAPDVLTLRVDLPDTVKIDKQLLEWKTGDPAEPKSFEVTVNEPEKTKIKSVRAFGDVFQANLKELEAGKKYQIVITPSSTQHAAQAALRLDVTDPGPRAIYLRLVVEE